MGVNCHAGGPRARISQVADGEIVSWCERRFHAYEAFSRTERNSDARSHWGVPVENILHPTAGDPEVTEEHGDHDNHESELDARVLAPLYSSADRRFRKWEGVVWDSVACNYEDHPILCLLRSDWSLGWLDVCNCADASEKSCLGEDKVQEKLQVHPCQVACASLHRAGCCFGVFKFGRR